MTKQRSYWGWGYSDFEIPEKQCLPFLQSSLCYFHEPDLMGKNRRSGNIQGLFDTISLGAIADLLPLLFFQPFLQRTSTLLIDIPFQFIEWEAACLTGK